MKAWCRKCEAYRDVPFGSRALTDFGCGVCGSILVSTLSKDRKPLQRRAEFKVARTPSRKPRRRIWVPAREKVELENICRLATRGDCSGRLEAAHIIGRDRDQMLPLDLAVLEEWLRADERGRWLVAPDRIAPLCKHHHGLYDDGLVGLLGRLEPVEEMQAVADSHTEGTKESGIELARRRLDAPAYVESRAA